jgi:hypothetical protein
MAREESELALFATTVLSHLAMIPVIVQFVRKRWVMEAVSGCFTLLTSFMYHATQDWGAPFFLHEHEWHRLDNVAALHSISGLLIYMADFRSPLANTAMKVLNLFLIIIIQEPYPWDERFTLGPFLYFLTIPFIYNGFFSGRRPAYDYRKFGQGLAGMVVAILFFIRGLDDASDAYRLSHGMWHLVGGFGFYHLWSCVKNPVNDQVVRQLASRQTLPHP